MWYDVIYLLFLNNVQSRSRRTIIALMSWMMSLTSIFAIEIPVHDERVTDDADMLTTAEETELESQLQQLQDETGVELAILTIPTTDGQDIAQLGTEIAQSRGIGKSDIDNGILILIALNDRKWRINTGYGVEWLLPDALAYRIATEQRVPAARAGDYFGGLEEMISSISGLVHQDPEMIAYRADQDMILPQDTDSLTSTLATIWFFGSLLLWLILRPTLTETKKKLIAIASGTGGWTLLALILVWWIGITVFLPTLIGWMIGMVWGGRSWAWTRSGSGGFGWFGGWYSWWSFGWWFGWFGWWSFGGGGASGGR